MKEEQKNWKTEKLTEIYLSGVRGAIPFANEQIDIILRIISFFKSDVTSFLDLGCGDGILGQMILHKWNDAKGIFVDYSEPMIKTAKSKYQQYKTTFHVQDFGKEDWLTSISQELPVDAVVSGFSIHHQTDTDKKRIYNQIFNQILKPGGVFLNLEQVKSPTNEIETIFNEFFLDGMRKFQQKNQNNISIEIIEEEFYKDKNINILASVEEQCLWLRETGFTQVDCFFKTFEIAIFGGVKPFR